MSSFKKILLILIPIVAVFVLLIVLAVRMFNKIDKKFDGLEERIEQSIDKEEFELDIDESSKTVYGNGIILKESKKIEHFDAIVLKGAYQVGLIKSDTTGIILETDENLHQSFEIDVHQGVLEISVIDNIRENEKMNLYIYYTDLSSIEVNGAAFITNQDVLVSDKLEIELKGAGSIDLELKVDDLNIEMAGGTHAQLKGVANTSSFEMKGVGVLTAFKLITDSTQIHVAGAGTARVFAKQYLDAKISGAGSIKYMGNPKLRKKIAGFGKISQAEN